MKMIRHRARSTKYRIYHEGAREHKKNDYEGGTRNFLCKSTYIYVLTILYYQSMCWLTIEQHTFGSMPQILSIRNVSRCNAKASWNCVMMTEQLFKICHSTFSATSVTADERKANRAHSPCRSTLCAYSQCHEATKQTI